MRGAAAYDALVLNADFRPLSVVPLSIWSWQDSVKGLLSGKLLRVASYEREVRSPSHRIVLPSVVALKSWQPSITKPAFTRYHLFLRDGFACQYCGDTPGTAELTIDHVLPRVQGGTTTWDNTVACCMPCNRDKGGRTPLQADMPLRRKPTAPKWEDLSRMQRAYPVGFLHETWRDFLYWDSPLEP